MSLTPTLLLILDGYGLAPAGPGNAASLARTPNIDRLISLPGATRIDASGRVLMTADHGNVEVMLDETGHPQTAHTCNQVPLVVVERGADGERAVPLRSGGKLGDIAPTLLDLWGLAKPGVMSGESLVEGVRG